MKGKINKTVVLIGSNPSQTTDNQPELVNGNTGSHSLVQFQCKSDSLDN